MLSSSSDIGEAELNIQTLFQLDRRRAPMVRSAAGKREREVISHWRGKYTRSKFPRRYMGDVALDATLRAAAARTVVQRAKSLDIRPEDLREKVRRHHSPFVIAFVMDNSWSIHIDATLERTKGIILELLKDARAHRDKVALVAFRHSRSPEATVCLPPTISYALAAERLRKIPLSGSTPLPDGIRKASFLLHQEWVKYQNAIPVLVVITDGLPNVPIRRGGDPYKEIALLCRHLRWESITTIVVDTEPSGPTAGRSNCREMASLSRGKYLPLSELTRQSIEEAVASRQGRLA